MPIRHRIYALRLTALYVVLAAVWIGAGDGLVLRFASDVTESYRYQLLKGWVFVALSGLFVYWLARRTGHRWFESENALVDARVEFDTAERVAGVGHWVMDADEPQLRWSPEMFRIFGLAPGADGPSLERVMALIHPEDIAAVDMALASFEDEGGTLDVTHRIVQPGGDTRWVVLRGEVAANNGARRVTGTVQDITELKWAELDLRDAHARLDALTAHEQVMREEERQRLAMDIHDVIGAGLAGVRMALGRLEGDLSERSETLARVGRIERDIDGLIRTVRQLAADLRPTALDELGLVASLEVLIEEWSSRCGCTVEFVADEEATLSVPPERGIHIYRIVQEALTNVLRHAKAGNVLVTVSVDEGMLVVMVRDNGRGIQSANRGETSFGLANIRQRTAILRGEVHIGDAPGGGTDVVLSVPLESAA